MIGFPHRVGARRWLLFFPGCLTGLDKRPTKFAAAEVRPCNAAAQGHTGESRRVGTAARESGSVQMPRPGACSCSALSRLPARPYGWKPKTYVFNRWESVLVTISPMAHRSTVPTAPVPGACVKTHTPRHLCQQDSSTMCWL